LTDFDEQAEQQSTITAHRSRDAPGCDLREALRCATISSLASRFVDEERSQSVENPRGRSDGARVCGKDEV
jgi:hypothetical protein